MIQAVASNAASDEQLVDMLGELSGQELTRLREFGIMIQELAREGLDDMQLPSQDKLDWRARRDALGLTVISGSDEPRDEPLPGFLIDRATMPEVLSALGLDAVTAPDGEQYRIIAAEPNELLDVLKFREATDDALTFDRDTGDECDGDCCQW